jgi:ATP-dependent protease ClpP protease subunit
MEVNMNRFSKRTRSERIYDYPGEMKRDKESKIMFGANINKKTKVVNEDDDEDEPGIDFSKLFKRGSPEDNSYITDNNIYFNDDITMETINKLNKQLRSLDAKLTTMGNNLNIDPPPIRLHITSNGGSVFAAFRAINCMKSLYVDVHTIIDGYAASAATMISVCGDKRYINKYSNMLIHELRSATSWSRMSEIEDEVENMKKIMDQIKDIYVEHTNLSRSELNKLLKRDIDWDVAKCIQTGLVDSVTP